MAWDTLWFLSRLSQTRASTSPLLCCMAIVSLATPLTTTNCYPMPLNIPARCNLLKDDRHKSRKREKRGWWVSRRTKVRISEILDLYDMYLHARTRENERRKRGTRRKNAKEAMSDVVSSLYQGKGLYKPFSFENKRNVIRRLNLCSRRQCSLKCHYLSCTMVKSLYAIIRGFPPVDDPKTPPSHVLPRFAPCRLIIYIGWLTVA